MPTASPETAAQTASTRVLERYRVSRQQTAKRCAELSPEDQMVQSLPEASPVKWHQAHTSWFFETFVLTPFLSGYKLFDQDFPWLFNSYYKSLGQEIPEKKLRASFSRPSLDRVLTYRRHVDAGTVKLLSAGDVPDEVLQRVVLGVNHEEQHLELALTDIKHAFYTNPLSPAFADALPDSPSETVSEEWIDFDGGLREIGIATANDPVAFAFDNERPKHRVYLEPYALANRLVTCEEYLAFMEADGYRRPELWLSEGWDAVEREGWAAPLYWRRVPEGGWEVFTLAGWRNLKDLLNTPVCHISLFEADAFARWRGCRLPTEAEWENAAKEFSPSKGNLLESERLHPAPANGGRSMQMFGDCWEWTSSPYTGYPGYHALPGALGEYNGKFMSSQMVLRGGSCVTPESHIRATYRNFFPPSTRWQFSGLRLAKVLFKA